MRKAIDWAVIKRRLRECEAKLLETTVSPEKLAAVYRLRAVQLAARKDNQNTGADEKEVLEFKLGPERYGIEISQLSEVLPLKRCTPIPESPVALVGVINRRGDILPVIDLAQILGLNSRAETGGYLMILRHPTIEAALRVDELCGIRHLAPGEMCRSTFQTRNNDNGFIDGITADACSILSVNALLSHEIFTTG